MLQVDRYALLMIGVVGKLEVTVHRQLSEPVLEVVVLCHLAGHSYGVHPTLPPPPFFLLRRFQTLLSPGYPLLWDFAWGVT